MLMLSSKDLKTINQREYREAMVNKDIVLDHLPFANNLHKIARNMSDAPPKPKAMLWMRHEDFKVLLNNYYDQYRNAYQRMANDRRIKTQYPKKIAKNK